MDLYAVLAELAAERKKIDQLIQALESLQDGRARESKPGPASRRGRKYMSPEERQEVSRRMQRYWEGRRMAQGQAPEDRSNGA